MEHHLFMKRWGPQKGHKRGVSRRDEKGEGLPKQGAFQLAY